MNKFLGRRRFLKGFAALAIAGPAIAVARPSPVPFTRTEVADMFRVPSLILESTPDGTSYFKDRYLRMVINSTSKSSADITMQVSSDMVNWFDTEEPAPVVVEFGEGIRDVEIGPPHWEPLK